jgi:hypothetical protein
VNTNNAPPSSSSRRRLHGRPDVSRPAALSSLAPSPLLDLACGRAFEPPRTVRTAPPFLRRRPPRHAAPVRARHRGHPRPQCWVLALACRCVTVWSVEPRLPRDAPPCLAPRSRRALCSCDWPSCRDGVVQGGGRGGGDRTHPSATVKPAPSTPRRCSPVCCVELLQVNARAQRGCAHPAH